MEGVRGGGEKRGCKEGVREGGACRFVSWLLSEE